MNDTFRHHTVQTRAIASFESQIGLVNNNMHRKMIYASEENKNLDILISQQNFLNVALFTMSIGTTADSGSEFYRVV